MTRINGGVLNATTKKSLKEGARDVPDMVMFFSTSEHGLQWDGPLSELPEGVTLDIVGPDPFTARTWYASITRKAGKLVVS